MEEEVISRGWQMMKRGCFGFIGIGIGIAIGIEIGFGNGGGF
jgi:hypothetical protein